MTTSEPREPPDEPAGEPAGESSPESPGRPAQRPLTDWRAPPEPPPPPPPPPWYRRLPLVQIALAVGLGLAAVAAFFLALRAGGDEGPPAPIRGGTLRVGVVGLESLDPVDAREPVDVMVADQLFDTLVAYDPETLEPVPGLAESWDVNAAQTEFTFRLAEAATFHDGTPVTAGDVKFTLERIAAPGSESPLLAQLESVTGFAAYRDGTEPGLAGIEAAAPDRLVIRLDAPFSTLPSALGHPGFGVVPEATVTELGDTFEEAPVGSGPFRFSAWEEDGRVLLLGRHPDHEPAAALDNLRLIRYDDEEAAYRAFVDGAVEVAPVPPARSEEALERFGPRGTQPYLGLLFYAMNLDSSDLTDVRLRHAVSLAIDRDRIVADVYQGEVEVATGLVADGVPGRVADACGERCAFDPERARLLLAEAFPDGDIPEVAIDHDDDPTQAAVAASIAADLDRVGIPAVIRVHPFEEYPQFLVSGEAELFRLGWVGDYPSPDSFLTPLFASASEENLTGLSSPEVDEDLAAARAEADPERRQALYRRVEQNVLDQFVVVPVAQLEVRMAVAERVRDFTLNPLGSFDGTAVALTED